MSFDVHTDKPTELDPNVVDEQMVPGLRIPTDREVEIIEDTENTSNGDVEFTAHKWSEIATIDSFVWVPGNPEDDRAAYNWERVRIRARISDDPSNFNKNRFIEMQFMDFFMGLVPQDWDTLRAQKEDAPKGDIRRRLGAMKFETHENIKMMTKLLRATGYSDRLSPSKRQFYGFHTILDLLEGDGLKNIPVLVTIEKGRPAYNGKIQERILNYEAI